MAGTSMTSEETALSYARGIPLSQETACGALTLGAYLQEIVQRHGASEAAVIHLDGEVIRWSYDDLWARANEVARALKACGVGKGTRVGLLMTNRLEFLSCLFGTALAGGVATTISTFFTAPEIGEVLEASCCAILLVERHVLKKDFAATLGELEPGIAAGIPDQCLSARFPFLSHVARVDGDEGTGAVEGWSSFLARGDTIPDGVIEACAAAVLPSDPGTLFFSSGSTGKAKGIMSAHRAICLQLWRWKSWYGVTDPPRTWSANGFFFSGNFTMALGGTLSSGGCLLLQRWFDPEAALALIQAERATMLLAWPHQWPQLEAVPGYAEADLSALHYVDGAFPLAHHPSVSANWTEPRAYGSTETFTLISVFPAGTPESETAGSHGRPTAGSTIRIVDPVTGQTVPLGHRGEVAVKGPTLMLGYLGVPLDETLDDEGFFRTGDGGWLDAEGRLFWEGRLNDIIKTGGANVSPLEIDAVLRDCPGVKIAQTVGVPDPLLGEIVVSCVVPLEGAALSADQIRSFARSRLASFKVPRTVLFFGNDELKTTGSSKIKTADLRKAVVSRLR
ncbi:acyl-CoA synthetase (AMP-forming)/AMP-acid ligase II [Novosphingobium sp. ST904]|nr:acyl-CoA synthetase (AMP-forming)/AMP-acid ligase II [Novosphingobium sp. ST904]